MTDETHESQASKPNSPLAKRIDSKAKRMLRARKNHAPNAWYGLGMIGLIGWSVTVPTLIGAAAGMWLDKHHPGSHSWTLALLVTGLAIGCLNAWHWIEKEDAAMHDDQESSDE